MSGGFGGSGGGPGGGGGPGPGGQDGKRRGRRGRRGGRRRREGFGGPPGFGSGGGGFGGPPRAIGSPIGGTSPEDRGLLAPAGDRLLAVRITHDAPVPAVVTDRGVSPFALFAACILGVTESDGYRAPNAQDVGRRFGIPAGSLPQLLKALALDVDALRASGFDLVGAQMDVQVAPAGVSRTEIAKDLYKELLQLPKRATAVQAAAEAALQIPEPSQPVTSGPTEGAAGGGGT